MVFLKNFLPLFDFRWDFGREFESIVVKGIELFGVEVWFDAVVKVLDFLSDGAWVKKWKKMEKTEKMEKMEKIRKVNETQ